MRVNPACIFRMAVASLCLVLLSGPTCLLAAEPMSAAASSKAATKLTALTPTDDVGARIKRLHDQLHITSDQETLWSTVAGTMQDNAKALTDAMQARQDKMATMNAVEDIQSYSAVAEAHAAGLKKLAAAFAPLYAAMPPVQQQNANAVFSSKAVSAHKG